LIAKIPQTIISKVIIAPTFYQFAQQLISVELQPKRRAQKHAPKTKNGGLQYEISADMLKSNMFN
jgi:hypothetical protein